MPAAVQHLLQPLREATHAQRFVQLRYQDAQGQHSQRRLRPLGCFYWGDVWTLAAWCESRQAFRSFRLDRMADVQVLEGPGGSFKQEAGKSLADYLRTAAPPGMGEKLAQGA